MVCAHESERIRFGLRRKKCNRWWFDLTFRLFRDTRTWEQSDSESLRKSEEFSQWNTSMFVRRGDEKLTRKALQSWTNNRIHEQVSTTFSQYEIIQYAKQTSDVNSAINNNFSKLPSRLLIHENFHIDPVGDPWSRASIYAFTKIFVCGVHRAEATCWVRSPTAIIPRLSYCERSVVNVCHSRSLFVVL